MGQWLRGQRHGYGTRKSVPYGLASRTQTGVNPRDSLTSLRSEGSDLAAERVTKAEETRGGFVLRARSDEPSTGRRRSLFEKKDTLKRTIMAGLRIKRQRSAGDLFRRKQGDNNSIRSTQSARSADSSPSTHSGVTSVSLGSAGSGQSFATQDEVADPGVTETYIGEWKTDRRSGFGVCARSDGLKYEGEWHNDKKYGYGITTFKDGSKEAGKYKNNVLISGSGKKGQLRQFLQRQHRLRERVEAAIHASNRSSQIALQKSDIAASR